VDKRIKEKIIEERGLERYIRKESLMLLDKEDLEDLKEYLDFES